MGKNQNQNIIIVIVFVVGFLIASGHINLQPSVSSPNPTAAPKHLSSGSYGGGGATSNIESSSQQLGIYSDGVSMSPVTAINWGALSPNETKTISVYLLSELDFSYVTANWINLDPSSIQDYMDFSYSIISLAANQFEQFNLTLYIHPDIADIAAFSFDITVNACN